MLANFDPTLLLVMQHNVTGLKYFCKTSVLDRVNWYKGSGTRWTNHLNVHGRDVSVGVMGLYTDKQKCLEAALKFSTDNNIANSDEWANLVNETGMKGASMKGKRNPFYGKKHSPESIKKISQSKIGVSTNKGAYRSPEQKAKISASLKGRKKTMKNIQFFPAEEQTVIDTKASALAKLTALGLSEDEVKALVG